MKASHLKPLDKGDNFTNVTFEQTWNTHANRTPKGNEAKADSQLAKVSNSKWSDF